MNYTESKAPLKLNDLTDFENANNLTLPSDYRDFLIVINGGVPEKIYLPIAETAIVWFYGMYDPYEWYNFFNALDVFTDRIPAMYVPIAQDGFGNLLLMSLREENFGTIHFWVHEDELPSGDACEYFDNVRKIADSFTELILLMDNAEEPDRK